MPIKNHSKVELSDNYLNLVLIETKTICKKIIIMRMKNIIKINLRLSLKNLYFIRTKNIFNYIIYLNLSPYKYYQNLSPTYTLGVQKVLNTN
jgi:hypothetical protein